MTKKWPEAKVLLRREYFEKALELCQSFSGKTFYLRWTGDFSRVVGHSHISDDEVLYAVLDKFVADGAATREESGTYAVLTQLAAELAFDLCVKAWEAPDPYEYFPEGPNFWVTTEMDPYAVRSYCVWFDRLQNALEEAPHQRPTHFRLDSIPGSNADSFHWVIFDESNGHKGGRRYVWIFQDRSRVESFLQKQYEAIGVATLSDPHRVVLVY